MQQFPQVPHTQEHFRIPQMDMLIQFCCAEISKGFILIPVETENKFQNFKNYQAELSFFS